MTNIKIEGNKIIFPNGNQVECIYTIKDNLVFKNILVVLLEVPVKEKYNRNIFAFDCNGNKLWQIDNLFPNDDDCPYNMIKIDEKNLLDSGNWCGFNVKINPLTGEVLEKLFTK